MKIHELKTWPEHFQAIVEPDITKRKTLEIRIDDRGYEVGDCLMLLEWDPDKKYYTGRATSRLVTHCLRQAPWVPDGYVAMSIITRA